MSIMAKTTLANATFVLGAQDGEMREIEKILKREGLPYAHAATAGERSNSGQAYDSDCVVVAGNDGKARAAVLQPCAPAIFIECTVLGREPELRIDHHNPGDPGFCSSPDQFLEGSSLGQLLSLLDLQASSDQKLLAAADHCLTSAYAGKCPGVDPDELLFMRAAWQSLMTKRTLSNTMTGILDAAEQTRKRYDPKRGASVFSDPTRMPRDLPEGAARAGFPVIYRSLMPGGVLKEMIKGGDFNQIDAFMEGHKAQGRRVYGNPHRGYAGAYL